MHIFWKFIFLTFRFLGLALRFLFRALCILGKVVFLRFEFQGYRPYLGTFFLWAHRMSTCSSHHLCLGHRRFDLKPAFWPSHWIPLKSPWWFQINRPRFTAENSSYTSCCTHQYCHISQTLDFRQNLALAKSIIVFLFHQGLKGLLWNSSLG